LKEEESIALRKDKESLKMTKGEGGKKRGWKDPRAVIK